jgi:N-acetylglutamate synthase-like GNAT family acetyltransferase
MTYRIRRAEPSDFESICDLLMQSALSTVRNNITATINNGSSYWVAVTDTPETIGCIGLEHGGTASLLRSAVVAEPHQGMGLGRHLVSVAIDACRVRGDEAVFLFTKTSGPYWEKHGFRPVDTQRAIDALPDAPQVRSGIERGWITSIDTWHLPLPAQSSTGSLQ